MAAVIETKNLTKHYGKLVAVNNLSLTVEQGAIYGFVGPNGAGKTTTMRMLTTLLRPTGGDAWVAGHSVLREPRQVRRLIGYMPDFFGVYDDMTAWEYLDFFAACYDLGHRRNDMVDSLSRGMKQRLCLARTLAHDPQVLILDEPASGLDPRARVEIRELLKELSRLGKTIFFSTHILSDVNEICSHVGILEAGRLVTQGSVEDIQHQLVPHRRLQICLLEAGRLDEAHQALLGRPGVGTIRRPEAPAGGNGGAGPTAMLEVDFTGDDAAVSALLSELVSRGLPVLSFTEAPHDVEELFMQITKGIVS